MLASNTLLQAMYTMPGTLNWAPEMEPKSMVDVLAERLAHYMQEGNWSQKTLGKAAGVSQRQIGYLLDPSRRLDSKSGKRPGPTLVVVEKVADAIKVPVWELLFPMPEGGADPKERELHQRIVNSYRELAKLARETAEIARPTPAEAPERTVAPSGPKSETPGPARAR